MNKDPKIQQLTPKKTDIRTVEANAQRAEHFARYILESAEKYLRDHSPNPVDVFWGMHNAHTWVLEFLDEKTGQRQFKEIGRQEFYTKNAPQRGHLIEI